jgi:hypothetical protein
MGLDIDHYAFSYKSTCASIHRKTFADHIQNAVPRAVSSAAVDLLILNSAVE